MLLHDAGVPFTVIPTLGDETTVSGDRPQLVALDRAKVKALGAQVPPGATGVVVAADTIAFLGKEIFGKPEDDADAFRILSRLQGTTHSVITGHHCIQVVDGNLQLEASGLTLAQVTMRRLSEADIHSYIATGEHRGKAGAYALQENADRFVVEVQGSYGTVVGLSVSTVAKLYRELTNEALPVTGGGSRVLPAIRS